MSNIVQLLSEVSKAVGAVKKGKSGGVPYLFRGVDQVVNAVHPELVERGIVVVPTNVERVSQETADAKGKKQTWVQLLVTYTFYGPEGDSVSAQVASEGTDYSDKCAAKAMSVALRIALLQTLMLPTDDPDPDEVYVERGSNPAVLVDRERVIELLKSKEIQPADAAAMFASVGGSGKISECSDSVLLGKLFEHVKGS